MANQSTIKIEIMVDDKGSATIKQFGTDAETSLKGVEKSASTTAGKMSELKDTWTDLAVKGAAAWMLVSQAMEYVEKGAKAQQAEQAFRDVATAAGESSDKIIEAMKRASGGTVDDSDIMQKAIKGMLLGFDGSQLETIMAAARVSARATGEDVVTAYEKITDAISTDMPRALKQYGLITKEEIGIVNKALAEGVEDVNLYGLAMANAALQAAKMGDIQGNAAEKLQIFKAQINETKEAIGGGLIVVLDAGFRALEYFAGGVLGVVSAYARYRTLVYEVMGDEAKATANRDVANAAWEARNALIDKAGKAIFLEGEANKAASKEAIAAAQKTVQAEKDKLKAKTDAAIAVKKQIEEEKKAREKATELEKKAADDLTKSWQKHYEDKEKDAELYAKAIAEFEKDQQKAIEKTMETWRKAGDEAVDAMEKEIDMGVNLSKDTLDRIEKRGEAEREIYKDLRGYEDQYFAASQTLIDAQAQKYRDLMISKTNSAEENAKAEVAISAWVAAETEKNDLKKAKSGSDFMAGVNAGLIEMQNNAMTFGKAGYEIFNTFAKESERAVSDILYQGIKDGTIDAQAVWTTFTDAMLRKLTDTISQMVIEAAANTVVMLFKATVSGDWSQILGLVNKGWDLVNSFTGGGSSPDAGSIDMGGDDTTGWMANAGGYGSHATGGPYDSQRPFWAGEKGPELIFPKGSGYVLTHEQSMAYAARNGGFIPGLEGGGVIPNYPYMWLDQFGFPALATGDFGQPPTWGQFNFDAPGYPMNVQSVVQIGENTKRIFYRDGTFSDSEIRTDPGQLGVAIDLVKLLSAAVIAYATGGASAAAGGGFAGAAIGGAAGGVSGLTYSQGNWNAAAMGAVLGAVGGYNATAGGTDSLLDAAEAIGTNVAKKWAIGQALDYISNAISGGTNGSASISFEGMDGDLSWLADAMGKIAPAETALSFPLVSAATGLDYVPRDNFRINAHEGEAVLTRDEAEDWRGGSSVSSEIRALRADLTGLRSDLTTFGRVLVDNTAETASVLKLWDGDGIPEERVIA